MEQYISKAAIVGEIERLHKEYRRKEGASHYRRALRSVLYFIDALEPKEVDLEKATGENLWKPADGEDLPEYEREVVVFTQDFPNGAGIMKVAIAHRPNPKGWDGKNIATGEVEHYTPKTYGKGGWNIPDVVLWLDLDIPNLEDD